MEPNAVVIPMIELRKGDWRYAMENAVDEAHTRYLHRRTPFALFRLFPSYQTDVHMVPTDDGKWLRRLSKPVFGPHTYPNVGVWPRDGFWRKAGGQVIVGKARLPGVFYVGHKNWHDYQFFTPVDEQHHLMVQVAVRKTTVSACCGGSCAFGATSAYSIGSCSTAGRRLHRPSNGLFARAPETPRYRTVAWRRWCDQQARTAQRGSAAASSARPGTATPGAASRQPIWRRSNCPNMSPHDDCDGPAATDRNR